MSQFPVKPGAVTPLTGSMAAGTVIMNNSGVASVWIDSSPGVAPGIGVRLGPYGSMTWGSAGTPAYACLDSGTVTAMLSVSADVSAVDNPVDIGVAVALQLAAGSGIPISNAAALATANAGAIAGQALSLAPATTSAVGAAVGAQALTLAPATTTAVGAAVGAQALTLAPATTTAVGTAVAAQALTLAPATSTAIGNAVGAQSLTLAPATSTAIGTAVGAQSLTLASATNTAIATAIAAKQLQLTAATSTAIGAAVAAQDLTIGSITGGNVTIANTSVVGNDVAVQINSKGVPATYTSTVLKNSVATPPQNVNIAAYASLYYAAYFSTNGLLTISILDSSGNFTLDQWNISISSSPNYQSFNIPANGLFIYITFSGTSSQHYLTGSNLAVPRFSINQQTTNVEYSLNQAWTNGGAANLGVIVTNGGPHQYRAFVSGAATNTGYFRAGDYAATGGASRIDNRLVSMEGAPATPNNTGFEKIGVFYLPPGAHMLTFLSYTAATFTATLSVQSALI